MSTSTPKKKSGLFRSPPGTPVGTPNRRNSRTPVGTSNRQLNNNQNINNYLTTKVHDLREAINILRGNSNNITFNEFKNNFNNMSFDNRFELSILMYFYHLLN